MGTDTSIAARIHHIEPVLNIIRELALKSVDGKYIYRGERKLYAKVSSGLYRQYEDISADDFDVEVVQREILEQAKWYTRYTGERDELEILSQLQHYGGETNLIDFTTDLLVALFFACDGSHNEEGRVVLLPEVSPDYEVFEPSIPVHRVLAQKSVFVRPKKGFIEPYDLVIIPKGLKAPVLDFLRDRHGISTETIYNDLYGFIKHQGIHRSAHGEFHRGFAAQRAGNHLEAINHYTNALELNPQLAHAYDNRGIAYAMAGDYERSIKDHEAALEINPEHPVSNNNLGVSHLDQGNYQVASQCFTRAIQLSLTSSFASEHDQEFLFSLYCNRGEAWLHLGEWDKAREDLGLASRMAVNVPDSFHMKYINVADFEEHTGLHLPEDIAEILGG